MMNNAVSGAFVDASAIVGLLLLEDGWRDLSKKLEQAESRYTSPLALWEAVNALVRVRAGDERDADASIENLLTGAEIIVVDITAQIGLEATAAFRRFGKGRHPARLNMGDCFSYACAKAAGVPLLYVGDDFAKTDLA